MDEEIELLHTDPVQGLTSAQAEQRIAEGLGAGQAGNTGKSEKEIILRHTLTFFNLVFIVLAVLLIVGKSTVMNMGFLGVVVVNTVIGIFQEIRAKRAVDKLSLVARRPVKIVRDGRVQDIAPEDIVRDDIAEFGQGDQICADGILRSGSLYVDESLLTGEEDSVEKQPGDQIHSGSVVLAGRGRVELTAVGENCGAAALAREAKHNPQAKKSEMTRSLDRLILFLGLALVPVGIILFRQEYMVLKLPLRESTEGTVAALVGMIPEGLYLLTSVALAVSAQKLSKSRVLVQDMNSIEALARVDVLCVDKTGTITEPDMEVENLLPLGDALLPEQLEDILTAIPRNTSGAAANLKKAAAMWWARRNSCWVTGRTSGTSVTGRRRATVFCWWPDMTGPWPRESWMPKRWSLWPWPCSSENCGPMPRRPLPTSPNRALR